MYGTLLFAVPGGMEIIVLAVLVMVLFGADKIPELAKSVGKAQGELKKGKVEAEKEMEDLDVEAEEAETAD